MFPPLEITFFLQHFSNFLSKSYSWPRIVYTGKPHLSVINFVFALVSCAFCSVFAGL